MARAALTASALLRRTPNLSQLWGYNAHLPPTSWIITSEHWVLSSVRLPPPLPGCARTHAALWRALVYPWLFQVQTVDGRLGSWLVSLPLCSMSRSPRSPAYVWSGTRTGRAHPRERGTGHCLPASHCLGRVEREHHLAGMTTLDGSSFRPWGLEDLGKRVEKEGATLLHLGGSRT